MSSTYDFEFGAETPYGRAFELVLRFGEPGGLIVDLGCGHGALGDPLADAGFTYLGLDMDTAALSHVRERGHEAATVDLMALDGLADAISEATAGRTVSAILAMDVIEHLPQPDEFLAVFSKIAIDLGRPPLIASVPNVGHFDVGAKLLHGLWDTTETGLLDKTHVAFFTEARLTETMARFGWFEMARADLELHRSDQHFPAEHPGVAMGSTLAEYLRKLRTNSDSYGYTNQFVRAYTCGNVSPRAQEEQDRPGLSVIMRTQGGRLEILGEALLSLAGQTSEDFEVLLMVHALRDQPIEDVRRLVGPFSPSFSRRVRIIPVSGGDRARPLNEGLRAAMGHYVTFLDDDDLVTSDWVETFLDAGAEHPGAMIRTVTADQKVRRIDSGVGYEALSGAIVDESRIEFSLVRHLETNRTPICAFAVPLDALRTYSIEFDETLAVLEDWHFFIRAAGYCGVHNIPRVTSIYRRWDDTEASWHSVDRQIWDDTRRSIQLEMDSSPLLLPRGSATTIARMIELAHKPPDLEPLWRTEREVKKLRKQLLSTKRELKTTQRRVSQMEGSTSWRFTAPLRGLASLFKRKPSNG